MQQISCDLSAAPASIRRNQSTSKLNQHITTFAQNVETFHSRLSNIGDTSSPDQSLSKLSIPHHCHTLPSSRNSLSPHLCDKERPKTEGCSPQLRSTSPSSCSIRIKPNSETNRSTRRRGFHTSNTGPSNWYCRAARGRWEHGSRPPLYSSASRRLRRLWPTHQAKKRTVRAR